jgi:nucleoside permease NupC
VAVEVLAVVVGAVVAAVVVFLALVVVPRRVLAIIIVTHIVLIQIVITTIPIALPITIQLIKTRSQTLIRTVGSRQFGGTFECFSGR